MLKKLIMLAVRGLVRGPGKSWVFTGLASVFLGKASKALGRRSLVESIEVKKGERLTVEHLDVSHRSQIKESKRQRKAERRNKKLLSGK